MVACISYFKVFGLAIFCLSVRFTLQLSAVMKVVPADTLIINPDIALYGQIDIAVHRIASGNIFYRHTGKQRCFAAAGKAEIQRDHKHTS